MKFRRHLPASFDWRALFRRGSPVRQQHATEMRLSLKHAGIFFGAALIGYLLAALVLFRAPIFAQSKAVPRVRGLSADSARSVLQRSGLTGKVSDHVAHPSAPP